jgi:hypothetical protein
MECDDYQEFEKTVIAVLYREPTDSKLRVEIDHHSLTGTSPKEMAHDLELEYPGFTFDGYELKVN